jgi:hypothetical protein
MQVSVLSFQPFRNGAVSTRGFALSCALPHLAAHPLFLPGLERVTAWPEGRLALESAVAVDAQVAETSGGLAGRMLCGGFEGFLRRSLHRREHLQKIEKVLAARSA